ncbi:MAG: hypothetical protein O7C98_07465 [Planctomycetota bacterium]|nr:hypothetical protein [Planctomycetota bacterium]
MRRYVPILVLLTCAAVHAAEDTTGREAELQMLAALFDDEHAHEAVAVRFHKLALTEAAPLLDRLYRRLRTPAGQRLWGELVGARRKEIRRKLQEENGHRFFAKELQPLLQALSIDSRLSLGVAATKDGDPVLYFDAKTFPEARRLAGLEYFVCPDPPPQGIGSKAYECLAGMSPAEWSEFLKAYRPGRELRFRFIFGLGALVETSLQKALPWAEPGKAEAHGLLIGGNHDETKNRWLPPHATPIQIGIVLARRAQANPAGSGRAATGRRLLNQTVTADGRHVAVSVTGRRGLTIRVERGERAQVLKPGLEGLTDDARIVSARVAAFGRGLILALAVRSDAGYMYHFLHNGRGGQGWSPKQEWLLSEPLFTDTREPWKIVDVCNPEGDTLQITFQRGALDPRGDTPRGLEVRVYSDVCPQFPKGGGRLYDLLLPPQ